MHRDLADIWPAIDRDPDVRVVLVRGEGKAFSSGGSFDLIAETIGDYEGRIRIMREARDWCSTWSTSTSRWSRRSGPGRRRRSGGGVARRHLGGGPDREDHRRAHQARGGGGRPRRDLLAAAGRHGQGQVLPTHLRHPAAAKKPSASAWSRPASTTTTYSRPQPASPRIWRTGAQNAIRWTKHSLNHWYRMFAPAFETSLGLEFFGFSGPDVQEGWPRTARSARRDLTVDWPLSRPNTACTRA